MGCISDQLFLPPVLRPFDTDLLLFYAINGFTANIWHKRFSKKQYEGRITNAR
jgi:hypothetical protein